MRCFFSYWFLAASLFLFLSQLPGDEAPPAKEQAGKPAPLPEGAIARLGSVAFLADSPALCLAVSRDGKFLATATAKELCVWDAKTGNELHRFPGPKAKPNGLAITPDGLTLATSSLNARSVSFWDVAKGRLAGQTEGRGQQVMSFCLSKDGKSLATGDVSGDVILWEVPSGKKLRSFSGSSAREAVFGVALSPDGKRLAAAIGQGQFRVWDTTSGKKELFQFGSTGSPQRLKQVSTSCWIAFSPDGKTLAYGWSTFLGLWETERWTRRSLRSLPGAFNEETVLAFSPDGNHLAIHGWDHTMDVLDLKKDSILRPSILGNQFCDGFAFFPDGKKMAVLTRSHNVVFLDPTNGDLFTRADGHQFPVHTLIYSHDGNTLITSGGDRQLLFWDVKARTIRKRVDQPSPTLALALSPEGKKLAVADNGGGFRLLAFPSDKEVLAQANAAPPSEAGEYIRHIAFSPDGEALATRHSTGRVCLWSAVSGRFRATVCRSERMVWLVAFTRGGAALPSGDGAKFREDDLATGKLLREVPSWPFICAALSEDGKHLAAGGPRSVLLLFDATTGQRREPLDPSKVESVQVVAFSRDGRWLAAGDFDGRITLWEVRTGKWLRSLLGHADKVNALAFAPDGRTLASGSSDTTVLLWDVSDLAKRAAGESK